MDNSIVGQSRNVEQAANLRNQSNALQNKLNELYQKQLNSHENRLVNLEDNMRINGIQEMNIKEAGNFAVIRALDGKGSNAYLDKRVRSKTYSAMWRRFKKRFGIPRYGELPAKDYDDAMDHLEEWKPDRELYLEIELVNKQTNLEFYKEE